MAIELHQLLLGHLQGQRLSEKVVHLCDGEAHIDCLDFGEISPGSQPCEWQRRCAAREEEHVERSRKMFEEDSHGLKDARFADDMVIIKNEQAGVWQLHQVVEQQRQHSFHSWWIKWRLERRREVRQGRATKMCLHSLASSDQVAPEAQQIIVSLIEGDPGERVPCRAACDEPLAYQRGLSVAGRGTK